ncbi:hypothetical protein Tco_0903522 [Tanacetum coccineum]
MIREQDEEEEDEKSGTIFFLPTHKLYLRPICKFNPGNAFGSNQKESSSYEYQQSLMPKGITPVVYLGLFGGVNCLAADNMLEAKNAFRLMMGRELEGLSYKELDNLEPELHDGMLAPQLSIQKETT